MSSPFCSDVLQGEEGFDVDLQEKIDAASPTTNLGQITIPTPPPERTYSSPDSSRSHGSCISPQHSASATTSDSYIKGSSLEESPVSSPGSSCAGEEPQMLQSNFDAASESSKRESCICGPGVETDVVKVMSDEEEDHDSTITNGHNVPKNIKLPQSKSSYFMICRTAHQ